MTSSGSMEASARRRPGVLHQPELAGLRKPSQDLPSTQAAVPAHCQAVRSSATSQAAAARRTVRVSARMRTRTS